MADDSPQLPDETWPRGRWFGIGSRTSARRLRDGETPATEAEPEDNGSYHTQVLPTYRTYTRAEQRDATSRYSASHAGYYFDEPRTKIADEGLETPINQDGYVYTGEEHLRSASFYTTQTSRAPTKPYAGNPPAVTTITRNAYQSSAAGGPGGIPGSDADMAAWLMRGDF